MKRVLLVMLLSLSACGPMDEAEQAAAAAATPASPPVAASEPVKAQQALVEEPSNPFACIWWLSDPVRDLCPNTHWAHWQTP